MTKISTHLSLKELACKDGTPYPKEFRKDGRAARLADLFEDIRALAGNKPIIIHSAYRTVTWNRKIGGAPKSQHLEGRALDLKHTTLSNDEFYEIIKANVAGLGIGGLGRYKNFVHVDIRPGDRVVYWKGSGLKDTANA